MSPGSHDHTDRPAQARLERAGRAMGANACWLLHESGALLLGTAPLPAHSAAFEALTAAHLACARALASQVLGGALSVCAVACGSSELWLAPLGVDRVVVALVPVTDTGRVAAELTAATADLLALDRQEPGPRPVFGAVSEADLDALFAHLHANRQDGEG